MKQKIYFTKNDCLHVFRLGKTSNKEYLKENFCRFERKYCATDYNDIGTYAYFKKDKIVFVEYDESYEKKGILKCAEYSAKPLNY